MANSPEPHSYDNSNSYYLCNTCEPGSVLKLSNKSLILLIPVLNEEGRIIVPTVGMRQLELRKGDRDN